MRLYVEAVTRAPVFLGAAPEAGNVVRGLGYVPGSVLRGALAAEWIRRHGPPRPGDAAFAATFDGDVRYGPLIPIGAVVEPVSVLRCKRPRDEACHNTVVDLLAGDAHDGRCAACHGSMVPGKGRLLGAGTDSHTRVELTTGETAKDGQLFTREAIPAGTTLTGHVTTANAWLAELGTVTLWFGGRRTVGGLVDLALRPAGEQRPPAPDRMRLAVRLDSPGVFVDDSTRPVADIPAAELAAALGLARDAVTSRAQWVRHERVSGWHAASRLPKPEDLAVAAGSAALFDLAKPVAADQLARLVDRGIGLRRSEGFGAVTVNPPRWQPPPRTAPPRAATRVRAEVSRALEIVGREADPDGRLAAWLCDELRQQAERLDSGRPWPVDRVLDQRRELRHAAGDVRDAAKALFTADPDAAGLRAMADQMEGAR